MVRKQNFSIMEQVFVVDPSQYTCDTIYNVKESKMTEKGLVVSGTVKVILKDLGGKQIDTKGDENIHNLMLPNVWKPDGGALEPEAVSGLDVSMYETLPGRKAIVVVIIGDRQAALRMDTLNLFSGDGDEAAAIGL